MYIIVSRDCRSFLMHFIKSREHVRLEVVEFIGLSISVCFKPLLIVLAD